MSERTSPAAPFFQEEQQDRSFRLYELPAAFAEVEAMLVDGEMDDAALERLGQLEGTLAEKVQSCLCVARNFAARSEARQRESLRLASLAKTDHANELRLHAYVEGVLRQLKIDKIETDLFKVSFAKNPPKVVVKDDLDIETLPEEWLRTIPEHKELDKKKILAASKDCPLPFGVEVVQTDRMVVK